MSKITILPFHFIIIVNFQANDTTQPVVLRRLLYSSAHYFPSFGHNFRFATINEVKLFAVSKWKIHQAAALRLSSLLGTIHFYGLQLVRLEWRIKRRTIRNSNALQFNPTRICPVTLLSRNHWMEHAMRLLRFVNKNRPVEIPIRAFYIR